MLFGNDRTELRRTFTETWRKHQQGLPLEPLQARIADVVLAHPEYHRVLEDGAALEHDYSPESGQSNPFLHMSMHLALIEQQHTDRPMGINKALIRLQRRSADAHDAQHRAMECLGQALWEAQRQGIAPDEQRFLKCVQSLGKRR